MKKNTTLKSFFLAAAAVAVFIPVQAGSWNWTRPYKMPEKNVETLMIIGNYRKPRLLADLVQIETKQPILLIPADSDGKIYFLPAKDKTMNIEFEDLTDFIKYLNPNRIIVLGDERYVPEKYIKAIDPGQTVISISNKSWSKVADTTARVLDLTYLDRRYKEYEAKIESGELYRPDNPALEDDAFTVKEDSAPVIDIKPDDSVIVDETVIEKPEKKSEVPAMTDEPKLIDETEVVPK